MALLSVEHVSFSYTSGEQRPVRDICFQVEKGDYIALVGSNGSGKTTLARLICGFLEPTSGTIVMEKDGDGADGGTGASDCREEGPGAGAGAGGRGIGAGTGAGAGSGGSGAGAGGRRGIGSSSRSVVAPSGIVFQYPKDQIVSGIIARDTAFGPENLNCSRDEVEQRTIESLSVTDLLERAMDGTSELSLGQTQKLALSGILALRPNLLVLDEVTSMLDPVSRRDILDFLDACHKRNQTIIHITHDREEVLRANRVLVMEKGRLVFDGSREAFLSDKEQERRFFGGDEVGFERRNVENLQGRKVVFRSQNISFSYKERPILKDVSLELREGTITALTGPSGSGKSTFLELAAGLSPLERGVVEAVARPALALQDAQSALFEQFAADDVAFGPSNRGVKGKKLKAKVRDAMEKAGLPFDEFADRLTFMLSGGEKRKLSLAGIIALDSPVLFFDEPTAALDPESRRLVMRMFRTLAAEGKTILFSTHRLEEAAASDFHFHLEGGVLRDCSKGAAMEAGTKASQKDGAAPGEDLAPCPLPLTIQPPLEGVKLLSSLKNKSSITSSFDSIPDSPVKRLNAPLKYIVFLALFISSVFAGSLWSIGILFALSLLYALLARCPFSKLGKTFAAVLPWIGIFCLFQLVFIPPASGERLFTSWKWFSLSPSKLLMCAQTVLRTFAAFSVIRVFVFSIDEKQLLEGFSTLVSPLRLLHIPVRSLTVVVEIIFRFIPLLVEEAQSIIKTQLVRGGLGQAKGIVAKVRILFPLFVPLILQTLKRAEILADALTARYF